MNYISRAINNLLFIKLCKSSFSKASKAQYLIYFILLFSATFIFYSCNPGKTAFKSGKKKFDQAEYQPAIEKFQEAVARNVSTTESNYYIAEAYRRSNRIQESEQFYKKAIDGNIEQEEAKFYYGFALKAAGNYAGAESQLQDYIKTGTNFDLVNRAKNELENLKVIGEIASKKTYYKVENVDKLNTEHTEYSPFFNKKKLYFTSSRESEKVHAATGTGFTDIYEFKFDGTEKFSGQSVRLPDEVNTHDAHEASAIFSRDGKTMIFSRGNDGSKKGSQNVDLYTSALQVNGEWSEPKLLKISDPNAWDAQPALSYDGRTLYFASDRESSDAKGGSDIYRASKDGRGEWGNVRNLGSPINTRGNDMYPYETENGDLFFSSDGHPSFGSLDLFMVKKGGSKLTVENLGKPLNTAYDDFGMVFRDSIVGYFASNRPGGKGDDDVYEFTDLSKIRIAHYILDGSSFGRNDERGEFPLDSVDIKILNAKGDTIAKLTADKDGKFTTELEPEQVYTIIPTKIGFLKNKDRIVKFSLVGKKVAFKDLEPGENEFKFPVKTLLNEIILNLIITIDNIYYDFNKFDIRPDAAIQLDSMVIFLKDNAEISVELGSHTDPRGSPQYNRKLAQKRAESAVAYIVAHGIDQERITAKGYGEDIPLKTKDSLGRSVVLTEAYIKKFPKPEAELLFQKNRRTEFRITGINTTGKKRIFVKSKEDQTIDLIPAKPGDKPKDPAAPKK
ncbi:MAG TPA: OmpA family protein [Cytophagaceae bacterium]|jgi:peptidoglycan-associated lipoprotein